MELKSNWQTYRTLFKDKEAIITVNLDIAEQLDSHQYPYVVHFLIPFPLATDSSAEAVQQHLDEFSQTLLPLMAISDSLFAGYIVSQETVTLYFYTQEVAAFKTILTQLDFISEENITSQSDPNCDLYYDFLLPSPLEMKINATSETLTMLLQEGEDLAQPHQVTHKFQFENAELMDEFIDYFGQQHSFEIKYTEKPIQYDDGEEVYLVTLEHEISLDDDTIFNLVEDFELQAANYDGEYNGWECRILLLSEKPLH
jgi:uncharacterized protein (TIGR01619 family)